MDQLISQWQLAIECCGCDSRVAHCVDSEVFFT